MKEKLQSSIIQKPFSEELLSCFIMVTHILITVFQVRPKPSSQVETMDDIYELITKQFLGKSGKQVICWQICHSSEVFTVIVCKRK